MRYEDTFKKLDHRTYAFNYRSRNGVILAHRQQDGSFDVPGPAHPFEAAVIGYTLRREGELEA